MGRTAALIKREVKETYWKRKTGLVIQLAVGIVLVPTALYPVLRISDMPGPGPAAHSVMLGIFPVFIVVAVGVPFVIEHFYKDKMKRNIEVLLSLGFSPFEIWAAKIVATGAFALGTYCLGVALCLAWFGSNGMAVLSLPGWGVLNLLMLSPFLGITMLGAKGLLDFLLNDIRLLNIAFILPFALLFVFIRSILGFLGITSIDDRVVSLVLLAASVCVFSITVLLLRFVPKERWL